MSTKIETKTAAAIPSLEEVIKRYPAAQKITAAKPGTMHTVVYRSESKSVPGLFAYKKIRMHLTFYESQQAVKNLRASGVERSRRINRTVYYPGGNGLAFNAGSGKILFGFSPMEKLDEVFIFGGKEIPADEARKMIELAEIGKSPKKPSANLWRLLNLENIKIFN